MEFVPFGSQDKIRLTVKIIQDLIAVPTRSGVTCSERDAIKFMMMCQAKRLNPFEGDAYLLGYDTKNGPQFSLITAHQTYLKRAELHPEYDGLESGVILMESDGRIVEVEGDFHLHDQKVVGGWARVHFKNRKVPTYKRLRLDRFNKGFAQWQDDPAGMIVKCAEADALRSSFPTMSGGLYLREEFDFMPQGNGNGSQRPIFEAPNGRGMTPDPQKAAESPQPDAPSDQEPVTKETKPEPKPAAGGHTNYPKAIRGLLKLSKIEEKDFLAFCASQAEDSDFKLDDSVSLEEAAMVAVSTLQNIHDNWEAFQAGLKKWKEAK